MPDATVVAEIVGPVQGNAQAIDAAHGAPHGEEGGDGGEARSLGRQDGADFGNERGHQLLGGNAQQIVHDAFGEIVIADEAGNGRQKNQEREDREDDAKGNVAGKRYGLVGEQAFHRLIRQRENGGFVLSHPGWIAGLAASG